MNWWHPSVLPQALGICWPLLFLLFHSGIHSSYPSFETQFKNHFYSKHSQMSPSWSGFPQSFVYINLLEHLTLQGTLYSWVYSIFQTSCQCAWRKILHLMQEHLHTVATQWHCVVDKTRLCSLQTETRCASFPFWNPGMLIGSNPNHGRLNNLDPPF